MKNKEYVVQNIKDLIAYQKAEEATVEVYRITRGFPSSEIYGLTSQAKRATSSVALNLAEGNGVQYIQKKINFVDNAIGSANEMLSWTSLVYKLDYISIEEYENLTDRFSEIMRILIGYMKKLKTDANNKQKNI